MIKQGSKKFSIEGCYLGKQNSYFAYPGPIRARLVLVNDFVARWLAYPLGK